MNTHDSDRKVMKDEIKRYMESYHGYVVYPDDVAYVLRYDLLTTIEIMEELVTEGSIERTGNNWYNNITVDLKQVSKDVMDKTPQIRKALGEDQIDDYLSDRVYDGVRHMSPEEAERHCDRVRNTLEKGNDMTRLHIEFELTSGATYRSNQSFETFEDLKEPRNYLFKQISMGKNFDTRAYHEVGRELPGNPIDHTINASYIIRVSVVAF